MTGYNPLARSDFWYSVGLFLLSLIVLVFLIYLIIEALRVMRWSATAVYLTATGTPGVPAL